MQITTYCAVTINVEHWWILQDNAVFFFGDCGDSLEPFPSLKLCWAPCALHPMLQHASMTGLAKTHPGHDGLALLSSSVMVQSLIWTPWSLETVQGRDSCVTMPFLWREIEIREAALWIGARNGLQAVLWWWWCLNSLILFGLSSSGNGRVNAIKLLGWFGGKNPWVLEMSAAMEGGQKAALGMHKIQQMVVWRTSGGLQILANLGC